MGLRRRALGILLASRRLRWPGAKSEPLALPLRVRPAFIALTAIVMVLLALLGFHPTLASRTRINDKVLRACRPALLPARQRTRSSLGLGEESSPVPDLTLRLLRRRNRNVCVDLCV